MLQDQQHNCLVTLVLRERNKSILCIGTYIELYIFHLFDVTLYTKWMVSISPIHTTHFCQVYKTESIKIPLYRLYIGYLHRFHINYITSCSAVRPLRMWKGCTIETRPGRDQIRGRIQRKLYCKHVPRKRTRRDLNEASGSFQYSWHLKYTNYFPSSSRIKIYKHRQSSW